MIERMIGWFRRLFCDHDLYIARRLSILAEVRCRYCDGHWLYNNQERERIGWPEGATKFFDDMEQAR